MNTAYQISAKFVFLLLATVVASVCHGQVGIVQPRLAWGSPPWAGAAPVVLLSGARSNGFQLTQPKDRAWSAAIATLPVDLQATPVLAVSVTNVSPGAGWVIKLDDAPYDVAHPHELVPVPAGGNSPGRYLLDLRELSGDAWQGRKQLDVRLFVTGPPGASVVFSQIELLPTAAGGSAAAADRGSDSAKKSNASARLHSGAWAIDYDPAKRRLRVLRADSANGQVAGTGESFGGAVSLFLPGITNGKAPVVVDAIPARAGTAARTGFTLRSVTDAANYEARVTAYSPRDTGNSGGKATLFRWTVTAQLRKAVAAPDLRAVASHAEFECLYEPANGVSDSSSLPLRVLSQHRFGQLGQETGQAFLPCDPVLGGGALYVQNLTALAPFFNATHTSGTRSVSAGPEGFGFNPSPVALPPAARAEADAAQLPEGMTLTLTDSFLALDAGSGDSAFAAAPLPQSRQYIDRLATIYDALPARPATVESDWSALAERALVDLQSPACWSSPELGYLRSYVNEPWGTTTGELSVQLAPLVASLLYERARQLPQTALTKRIAPTLVDFYSADGGTIHEFTTDPRPARADSETQVGSLMLLAQASELGLPQAKTMLRDSLPATISLARRHQYRFPVFFDPKTLNLIGGIEPDCTGVYAYLMLQCYRLFGDASYLDEARKALSVIDDFGMNYGYELHGTAIGAVACAQMWKITGDRSYLDKSLLPLANVLRHCWLYEPEYGFRKGEHHFFTVSAMPGIYAAPAEQYQAWLSLREYDDLVHDALPASARLLLGEFLRYGPTNILNLYPAYLTPRSIALASERGGKLEPDLLVPIEDLNDPWLISGRIGQEVYGAGGPLAVAARTVSAIAEAGLTISSEYPIRERIWNAPRHILRLSITGFADKAFYAGRYTTRVTVRYDAAKAGWPAPKRLRIQVVAGTGQITDRRDKPGYLSFQLEGGTTLLIDAAPMPTVAPKENK